MDPKFLLDTNICIYIRRRRPPEILKRFSAPQVGRGGARAVTATDRQAYPCVIHVSDPPIPAELAAMNEIGQPFGCFVAPAKCKTVKEWRPALSGRDRPAF